MAYVFSTTGHAPRWRKDLPCDFIVRTRKCGGRNEFGRRFTAFDPDRSELRHFVLVRNGDPLAA